MALAVIPLFRARVAEVRAIDCGDGRHLLMTEPPRYAPSAAFLEDFELVAERRAAGRRRTNGRSRTKAKAERRKPTGPRAANGDNPKKAAAQRLFEQEGLKLPEISKKTGVPYATVYSWSKQWKPAKAPTVNGSAETRMCGECH
jgi:hypothetical protein